MNEFLSASHKRILVVGNFAPTHIGAHLGEAAQKIGLTVQRYDSTVAYTAPWIIKKFNWWFCGHRPADLQSFSNKVVQACKEFHPSWVLSTGLAPLEERALMAIGKLGIHRLNYLTDDPWNPSHHADWFIRALPSYDIIFSVRHANLEDLRSIGCKKVFYLPFAYQPEIHFPEEPSSLEEKNHFVSDVVFAGGGDVDRVPYITALLHAGVKVALYGTYWDRFRQTRDYARGQADASTLRKAVSCSKVALCLVRRANRDGNSMRSFELPAIGACMLVEDTLEHREIFGSDRECVVYFNSIEQIVEQLKWLLKNDDERVRLKKAVYEKITHGQHTYRDRLLSILKTVDKNEIA